MSIQRVLRCMYTEVPDYINTSVLLSDVLILFPAVFFFLCVFHVRIVTSLEFTFSRRGEKLSLTSSRLCLLSFCFLSKDICDRTPQSATNKSDPYILHSSVSITRHYIYVTVYICIYIYISSLSFGGSR